MEPFTPVSSYFQTESLVVFIEWEKEGQVEKKGVGFEFPRTKLDYSTMFSTYLDQGGFVYKSL